MPIGIYLTFLGRFPLESREYVVLKNAFIEPLKSGDYGDRVVQTLCSVTDGDLLLERSRQFYLEAAQYIEAALKAPGVALFSNTEDTRRRRRGISVRTVPLGQLGLTFFHRSTG